MNIVIHQFKRELQAQQFGILLLCSFSALHLIGVGTGFFGEFYRTETVPIYVGIFEVTTIGLAILPILLAAAFAIEDPPFDLEAHWRCLPVQRIHLLTAKIAAVLIGVILPIYASRVLGLLLSHQWVWIDTVTWDLLSNIPAWIMIAFGLGALFGSWKHFIWAMITLLAGMSLFTIAIEGLIDFIRPTGVQVYLRAIDNAMEYFFSSNLLLPSGVVIVALCYFTRLGRIAVPSIGFFMIPITALAFPFLTKALVPKVSFFPANNSTALRAEIELPDHLISVTNHQAQRVALLPYRSLKLTGVDAPQFIQPLHLSSTLEPQSPGGSRPLPAISSRFHFPRSPFYLATGLRTFEFMERHLFLPRAVANHHIINPPFLEGDGFNLFEITESALRAHSTHPFHLNTHLSVQLGTYAPVAILPLRIGETVVSDGTHLRIAELIPQVAGRTQVMVNEHYVTTLKHTPAPQISEHLIPASRNPNALRYILVNPFQNEACLPVKHTPFREHRLPSLAMRSSIVDFSISEGPDQDHAIPADWLEGASLHVFRRVMAGHATLQFQTSIDIGALPTKPSAKPSFPYR